MNNLYKALSVNVTDASLECRRNQPSKRRLWCTAGLAVVFGLTPFLTGSNNDSESEGRLLSRVRQLTFEGRRAGEGYFSRDGLQMIFQSEREPGNPFFQIYHLDLETGDVARVSPGTGKTTCSWIHPDGLPAEVEELIASRFKA